MSGRFPQAWMDQFYAQIDIVQVVSAYVPLKKNGRNYIGLCPFHHEKTPSFNVNRDKNLYYCFGCKAGGNVVQFVMQMEHLNYTEAVRFIADQAHIAVPEMEFDPEWQKREDRKARLYELNAEAARYYHHLLWTEQGKDVLAYFRNRGLTDDVIRKFGLGAAPDEWDQATRFLTEKGYPLEDLEQAGLCTGRNNRTFDMFRHRAMFPIISQNGHVLGFGGRILGQGQPKYLNTADTLVFNKRKGVFAANLLRKARDLKRVLLVEGYMDVISLTQYGVEGAAATLGTALTPEQARLLHRFAPEVWVAYDGDAPGQNAILKALGIFQAEGIPAKVLVFPDGLDPDEFIRQRGKEAFDRLKPLDPIRYRMNRAEEGKDLSKDEDRLVFAKECAQLFKQIREPVELDYYLGLLSMKTGFDKEVLRSQIGAALSAPGPAVRPLRSQLRQTPGAGSDPSYSEKMLFGLLLTASLPKDTVSAADFLDPVYQQYAGLFLTGQTLDVLIDQTDDPTVRSKLTDAVAGVSESAEMDAVLAAQKCLRNLRIDRFRKDIALLKEKAGSMPQDQPERQEIIQRIMMLQKEVNQLKQPQ